MTSIINPTATDNALKTAIHEHQETSDKKVLITDPLAYINSHIKNMEVAIKLPLKFYHDYNEYAEQYNREVAKRYNLPLLPTYEELQKLINQPGEGTVLLSREKGDSLKDFEQSFVLHPLLQRFSGEFRKKLAEKALNSYAPLANKIIIEGLPAEIVQDNKELVELFERIMDIQVGDSEATKKMKQQTPVMMIHKLLPDFFPILTLLTWAVATRFTYQANLMENKALKRRSISKRSKSMEIGNNDVALLSEAGPLANESTELDEFFGCVKGIEGRSLDLSYIDNKNHILKNENMLFLSIGVKRQVGLEGVHAQRQRDSVVKRLFKPVTAALAPIINTGRSIIRRAKKAMSTVTAAATRVLSRVYLMEKRTWIDQGSNAFTRLVRRAVHGVVRGAANLFFKKRSMHVKFNREHMAIEIRSQAGKKIEIYEKELAQNINVFTANMNRMREVKSFEEAVDVLSDIKQQICDSSLVKREVKESLHFSLELLEAIAKEKDPEVFLEKFLGDARLNDDIQVLVRDLSNVAIIAHKDPSKLQSLVDALATVLNPREGSAWQDVDNIENLQVEWERFNTNMKAKELQAQKAVEQVAVQAQHEVKTQQQAEAKVANKSHTHELSDEDFLSDTDQKKIQQTIWKNGLAGKRRGVGLLGNSTDMPHRHTIN